MSSSDPKLSYFWLVQLSALISELFYGIDFLLIVHAYCIDMLHSIDFDILHSNDFDMLFCIDFDMLYFIVFWLV